MPAVERSRGLTLLLAIGVLAGTAGWFTGSAVSADPVEQPEVSESSGETVPDGPVVTEVEAPLRVTLAGDSVMAGLAPAVIAALEGGGDAEVEFILTPSVLRDATVRFTWSRQLESFDPDVVVMLVGTWELGEVTNGVGTSVTTSDPTWSEVYSEEILDPWIDLVTTGGARVVWLGAPAVATDEVSLLFADLNAAYRDLANRRDEVTYLDSTGALAGSGSSTATGSGFAATGTDDQGRPVRLRQIDGLHLCPDGAVRLARALVEELESGRELSLPVGWESAGWRNDEEYPRGNCPPA